MQPELCLLYTSRDQVEVALHHALPAEFRTAVLARMVIDDLLADMPEPRLPGEHRNEAVHLAVNLDRLDDLRPVGLQAAVEVVEADTRGGAGRPVEELAGPSLAHGVDVYKRQQIPWLKRLLCGIILVA